MQNVFTQELNYGSSVMSGHMGLMEVTWAFRGNPWALLGVLWALWGSSGPCAGALWALWGVLWALWGVMWSERKFIQVN